MKSIVAGIRTQGGEGIGLGHVRRCLTLAHELRKLEGQVYFAVNPDAVLLDTITAAGFEVSAVDENKDRDLSQTLDDAEHRGADVVVIDSYEVQGHHLGSRHGQKPALVVIDDLADRFWPVDLVVNGGAQAEALPYNVAAHTRLLLGPQYSMLREEFSQVPHRDIRDLVQHILITVGGSDPGNLSPRLAVWTRESLPAAKLEVVIGPFFTSSTVKELELLAEHSAGAIVLHNNPPQLRDLMRASDVAVAAGGQTVYELAATGTPTLAIRTAANQTGNVQGLSGMGALVWVGDAGEAALQEKLITALTRLAERRDLREAMSRTGRRLVDGLGVKRVAHEILSCAAQGAVRNES